MVVVWYIFMMILLLGFDFRFEHFIKRSDKLSSDQCLVYCHLMERPTSLSHHSRPKPPAELSRTHFTVTSLEEEELIRSRFEEWVKDIKPSSSLK